MMNPMGDTREGTLDAELVKRRTEKKKGTSWIRLHVEEKKAGPSPEQTPKRPSKRSKAQAAEGSSKDPAHA
jgi:hypothetical protein